MLEKLLLALLIAFVLGSIGVVAYMVSRFRAAHRQEEKISMMQSVLAGGMAALVLIGVAANGAAYRFNNVISQFMQGDITKTEAGQTAAEAAKVLTEELENEGIVLLKNQNQALPLAQENDKERKINVFGYTSISLCYGGSGSGHADESQNIDLQTGLQNAGFEVNQELTDFYTSQEQAIQNEGNVFNMRGGDFNIYEPAVDEYPQELLDQAKEFSDVALVVISRRGGEGADLPMDMEGYIGGKAGQHYLELADNERAMLDMVKEMGFAKVVVVVNSSNAMELGFLEEEGVDAAIWVGGPGSTGCNSIGSVLSGAVNPSGRLVDTYAYDVTKSPAYYNAGNFWYSNTEGRPAEQINLTQADAYTYVDYAEGIYVGYRYYETRYVDNETGLCDENAYWADVQYPFGYGLSYTDFSQEIVDYTSDEDTITMTVRVTNTGDCAGKEVVQLYYTAPYYIGQIEKSHVVLGAFGKTDMLEPGASEEIVLQMNVEDMASYDYVNNRCYVLDAGDYIIKLMKNAHEVIDTRVYNVPQTIVYDEDNKRSSDLITATNLFDDALGDVEYVSRADWENTLPTQRVETREASDEIIAEIEDLSVEDNPADPDIVYADNGLTLQDMAGLAYDDPQWEQLLQQLSVEDMVSLIGIGGYATIPVESIDKPGTSDLDGPAGVNGLVNGAGGTQYVSEVVIASTWNLDLAYRMGECFGDEAYAYGVAGLYAPAMNIHRTPFTGRNFEYYSEDGYLSGMMGSEVVQGMASKGIYGYIKHFALNDQETNRLSVCVWTNEQAMRELYFKPFEIAVKQGGATAVMSARNRVGTRWVGASYEMMTTVLRDEWGFQGMVISDMANKTFMDPDQAIRAGNDLMLTTTGQYPTEKSTETTTGRQALRNACHNILYTIANSAAFEVEQTFFPYWAVALAVVDVLLLAGLVLGVKKLVPAEKKKKDQ